MIKRTIASQIQEKILNDNKVVILYGPRRVGKTTLINYILDQIDQPTLRINAEELPFTESLNSLDLVRIKAVVENYRFVFIDEAQHLANPGLTLKLIHDHLPDIKLIAAGSSSFELSQNISQPLTGRKWTFQLLPISLGELSQTLTTFQLQQNLEQQLIWGFYPDIFSLSNQNGCYL